MEDFFAAIVNAPTESDLIKMDAKEFETKTKKVLSDILKAFKESWYDREITDEEAEIAPCEGCKGSGCFEFKGNIIECSMDIEAGGCFERAFCSENYYEQMTDVMFDQGIFLELIEAEVVLSKEIKDKGIN